MPPTPDAGIWFATVLNAYMASPSAEPVAQAVLARMVLGLRWNPVWQAQQARTNARVAEINRQTHEEISGIINRTWEEKSRSWDRSRENWSTHDAQPLGQGDADLRVIGARSGDRSPSAHRKSPGLEYFF
jgi:hypothetical protein